MDKDLIAVAARINLHHYLLELIHFNIFASMPDSRVNFEQVRKRIVDQIQFNITVRDDAPDDLAMAVQEETVREAERFFDAVSGRLTEAGK